MPTPQRRERFLADGASPPVDHWTPEQPDGPRRTAQNTGIVRSESFTALTTPREPGLTERWCGSGQDAAAVQAPFLLRGRTIQPISTPTISTGITGFARGSINATTTNSPTVHGDTRAQAAGRSVVGSASQNAPSSRPTRTSAAANPSESDMISKVVPATVQPIASNPTSALFLRSSVLLIMSDSSSC